MKTDLKKLHAALNKSPERIWVNGTNDTARRLASKWFDTHKVYLDAYGISDETLNYYDNIFKVVLKKSMANGPSRGEYIKLIVEILRNFDDDLLIPVRTYESKPRTNTGLDTIDDWRNVLPSVSSEELDYLEEALGCASAGFFRASVVLGWCAAIDRLRKVIERVGFDTFNSKSREMKQDERGRFGKWNKDFTIKTRNDLNFIFDSDLLWMLEGLGLIDNNQHKRLEHCFTMRSNAAHPGKATITKQNLLSFYSDLREMVFDNPDLRP